MYLVVQWENCNKFFAHFYIVLRAGQFTSRGGSACTSAVFPAGSYVSPLPAAATPDAKWTIRYNLLSPADNIASELQYQTEDLAPREICGRGAGSREGVEDVGGEWDSHWK